MKTDARAASPASRRRCAAAAMAGVTLYVVVDVILQFLPPHYSAIRDAESNLAVGPYGWIMNLNFLGRAATTACAVVAISRVGRASPLRSAGLVLLAAGGVASAILAFFPTDIHPDTQGDSNAAAVTYSSVGVVHLTLATIGFLAALAAVIALTLWLARVPQLTHARPAAAGFAVLAIAGLLALGLSFTLAPRILGLAERICLAGILGWTFVACAGIRSIPEIGRLQP
jgi:Protein of unknown function (DUF998)